VTAPAISDVGLHLMGMSLSVSVRLNFNEGPRPQPRRELGFSNCLRATAKFRLSASSLRSSSTVKIGGFYWRSSEWASFTNMSSLNTAMPFEFLGAVERADSRLCQVICNTHAAKRNYS